MNTTNYPSIISVDHESNPRLYETSYNTYSPYTDYPTASKLEAFDYNYWPTSTPTTHNILTIPSTSTTNPILDQIPPSPSTNQTLETLVPASSLQQLAQINSTTISSTHHHHHHIHQHLYPSSTSSNDSSNWLTSTEYQSSTPYRHYSYPNNNFYDQTQWPPSTSTLNPIKFESPYSPPSYFDSSHNLDQPLSDSKEEPSDSSYSKCQDQQLNWYKPQLTPVPPKNPANGMLHTSIDLLEKK
jgi:hypothetical protein